MNCLSHRALLGAVFSVGAAVSLILVASGAYAGAFRSATVPTLTSTSALTLAEDEPAIVFTGSGMAPLVCTSTPDSAAVTITDDMRITLANLTGADASVDTGTAQALTVADGVGISVRFRPGQYAIRLVPDCTMTNDVGASVVTVKSEPDQQPKPTGATPPEPTLTGPPAPGDTDVGRPTGDPTLTGATVIAEPSPSSAISASAAWPPSVAIGPVTQPAPQASAASGGSGASGGPSSSPAGSLGPTLVGPGPPSTAADAEPVIYDVVMVSLQQPGDPRDDRLLAVIAVICVFGVTTAIIRAILSQRARGMVST
jgi:hypothetical protein